MPNMTQNKTLYRVHCTECGNEIESKFFPLDKLLKQYYNGQENSSFKRDDIIAMLGIGAVYGTAVLPEVPPLLERTEDQEYTLQIPELAAVRPGLHHFECEENEIFKQPLTPVSLNIASIVAQFCLCTGFFTIYRMLLLQKELNDQADSGEDLSDKENDLNIYCDKFAEVSGVSLKKGGTAAQRRQDICKVLNYILQFAKAEADMPAERHFATEPLYAGWRYKVVNGRNMPLSLVVTGAGGHDYSCTKCCCSSCRQPISFEMGAYEQRIIGLLGTQATGKTTYLMALIDSIERGEVTTMNSGSDEQLSASIRIERSLSKDQQWARVIQEASRSDAAADTEKAAGSKAGPLWLYRNGYPPEKTDMKELEAPALSFLVSRKAEDREPVMYTLADIPGEAFDDVVAQKYDPQLVKKVTMLLHSCSAYLLVVSSRQMAVGADGQDGSESNDLVKDPNRILICFKHYLPSEPLPTAVVMTASDEINGGDLRKPMHLAYDLRKCSPLVWSDRTKALVYNAEAMSGAVRAVKGYFNNNSIFKVFMDNLAGTLSQSNSRKPLKLAAFAASSGTQHAPISYQKANDEYRSLSAQQDRYGMMCQGRFGVAAPLLWLLACDGMLEVGRGDNDYNDYSKDIRAKIQAKLEKSLYN